VSPDDIKSVDALTTLIAGIIYRATVYHAAINYAGYDWQLFAPCKSASGYAMAPGPLTVDKDDSLRAMLPSLDLVEMASTLLLQQREILLSRLLYYPTGHFSDPRVAPLMLKAQRDLTTVDEQIADRNLRRPLEYGYASPVNVPNSIMV
jgi:arachidonate 15-lipoxygenase